jgi:hypothetical protein
MKVGNVHKERNVREGNGFPFGGGGAQNSMYKKHTASKILKLQGHFRRLKDDKRNSKRVISTTDVR